LLLAARRKIRLRKRTQAVAALPALPNIDEILKPAQKAIGDSDQEFFASLRSSIWAFITLHFNLAGSEASRSRLISTMQAKNVDRITQVELVEILEACETGMFASAQMETDRKDLFARTRKLLEVLQLAT
jgi:hypothetical protein